MLINIKTCIFKQEEAENLFQTCSILKDISEEETFRCDLCDFATVCASGRDQHRQHHGKKAPFSCPLCQYGALSIAGLNRHFSKGHRFHQSPGATPLIFPPSLSNMEENIVEDPSVPAKKSKDSSVPDNDMQWVYLCQHCSFWTTEVELFHVHQVESHLPTESNNANFYYAQRLQDVRILNQIKNESRTKEKDTLDIYGTSGFRSDLISEGNILKTLLYIKCVYSHSLIPVDQDRMTLARLQKKIEEGFRQLIAIRKDSSARLDILRKNVKEMEEKERISRSRVDTLTVERDITYQKLKDARRDKIEFEIEVRMIQRNKLELQIGGVDPKIPKSVLDDHNQQISSGEKMVEFSRVKMNSIRREYQSLLQQIDRQKETWKKDSEALDAVNKELDGRMEELKRVSDSQRQLLVDRNILEKKMLL